MDEQKREYNELVDKLLQLSIAYYDNDAPLVSDYEYDMMNNRLKKLEAEHPDWIREDSPTQHVGGHVSTMFSEVRHPVPLQSLQDLFSFEEVDTFIHKVDGAVAAAHDYVVEPKIDGLSIAIEYRNGEFWQGATRGNGDTGEDVTENLRTIRSLPKTLENAPERLIVRGEVYMSHETFNILNARREVSGEAVLANPRNAAAGSLRQKDPKVCAERTLDVICFNIQLAEGAVYKNHYETLEAMAAMGLPVVAHTLCKTAEECIRCIEAIGEGRENYPFDIDGAVVKLNDLAQREILGGTEKFPIGPPLINIPGKKASEVVDIVVQVGRTGVLTPKAVVKPVRLAGTTVTNATLHNQDFIENLGVNIGDTVLVQKAGEIIPEVLEVVKKGHQTDFFRLPNTCPVCGSAVARDVDGAAIRCTGAECPAQTLRNIVHFASKEAMDIDGLGPAVVESLVNAELIKTPADLYYLEPQSVAGLERMGQKSAENLIEAIEKSKNAGLARLLCAFGIRQVGQKAGKVLARNFANLEELMSATEESLTAIGDIGPITAQYIMDWFRNPQSQHQIERLKNAGVSFESSETVSDNRFLGKTFVLTGTLPNMTRQEAEALIESFGGKASGSVSKKTSYVLLGENPGSKLTKAQQLGIEIINEEQFRAMTE